MKKTVFISLSFALVSNSFAQLGFFDRNWIDKIYSIPTTTTSVGLPTTGIASATVNISLKDTLAKVLPTQLGTNTTFRSNNTTTNILSRLDLYKSSGMGTYRYPAGSGSNIFFWDGVAPTTTRPYLDNKNVSKTVIPIIGTDANTFNPEKFVQFKNALNCEANVNVNYFYARYGTTPEDTRPGATAASKREARVKQAAEYAAGFVRHMNVTLKAKIKYWEVGNEIYGNWEEGYNIGGDIVTGKEYGEDFNVFVKAMKAVDPSIKVGAVVWVNSETWGIASSKKWTSEVLTEVENSADFLILHEYFALKGGAKEVMESSSKLTTHVNLLKDWVVENTAKARDFYPITLTEFNTFNALNSTNMANGLFFTQMLGEIMKNKIGLATSWVNEWKGGGTNPEVNTHGLITINDNRQANYTPRSTFMAYHYYSKYFGGYMLNATSNNTNVKVYASGFKGKEVGLVLVNVGATEALVDINLDANKYNTAYWHETYALNVNSENSKFYINGNTSTTVGGGPANFQRIPPYESAYQAKSLIKIKPYSATYMTFANKIATNVENENESYNKIQVYPNPSNNGIFNISESAYWKVYSVLGEEMKSGFGDQINLSGNSKGVYLIKVNGTVERIVIE